LVLERRIPLPGVEGRIDHMALDVRGRRLFVAEIGSGAVDTVDLASGRVTGHLGGLSEPQGVGFLPGRNQLVVATGGDGMVRFYAASGGPELAHIALGDDADDVRVDPGSDQIAVGYGGGGIGVIDPADPKLLRTLPLPAHPEGFETFGGRVFVNLPHADRIAVVDLANGGTVASWPNASGHFNFPMAIDRQAAVVAVVYRFPARLALFDAASGRLIQDLTVCGDADDVWFDLARKRIYVSCGGGQVDVFARSSGAYARAGEIATRPGARTSLYVPTLDRLLVAAPARSGRPAEIWSFRPQ
jgi:hypothetical protein